MEEVLKDVKLGQPNMGLNDFLYTLGKIDGMLGRADIRKFLLNHDIEEGTIDLLHDIVDEIGQALKG